MKCIAAVQVDLETSPLGTRSRLADDLRGQPVLRRTMERATRAQSVASFHLLARPNQADAVKALVAGLPVVVETMPEDAPPYLQLVRAGRWWGTDSWRGGVGGLTVFDEDLHLAACHALARREQTDALLVFPAAACLIDPALLDGLVHHAEANADAARLAFVQAPPGLTAIVLATDVIDELAPTGQPVGALFAYHPDRPLPDLTGKEACYRPAAVMIEASGRLLADTERGVQRLRELLEAGAEDWSAEQISRRLNMLRDARVEPFPAEIEIELTTNDPLSATRLRPRGSVVPARGPIRLEIIHHLAEAMTGHDDVRVVIGGFGDPCGHPEFGTICRTLRKSAAAIAVRTGGLHDRPEVDRIDDILFETPIDVVEVTVDAATPQTYVRVHGTDALDFARERIERWMHRRDQHAQVRPLIVPSLVKSVDNLDDLEAFFDEWHRRLGVALVTGYSHHARQRPCRAVTGFASARRTVCRRTLSRTMVLADGSVTTCDQDFAGRQTIGSLERDSLTALWASPRLAAVREHSIADLPLCPHCDEWHRP